MIEPRRNAFIHDVALSAGLPVSIAHAIAAELAAPHRHYHGLGHHALMLRQLGGTRAELLACLYHDLVYDPKAKDNEVQSAALAQRDLACLAPDLVPIVTQLILATRGHEPTGDVLIDRFLRADLWILVAPDRIYDWYARGVRKEYGFVPDAAYAAARKSVLGGLADACGSLFTEEEQAQMRRNFAREGAKLG